MLELGTMSLVWAIAGVICVFTNNRVGFYFTMAISVAYSIASRFHT